MFRLNFISGFSSFLFFLLKLLPLSLAILSCAGQDGSPTGPGTQPRGFFASRVVAYDPAPGQFVVSYGDPTKTLGEPDGQIVTLGGLGGSITLELPRAIPNRPGPDFVVWGNALFQAGNPVRRWAEPAVIELSPDGTNWLVIAGSLFEGRAPEDFRRRVDYQLPNQSVWPPSLASETRLSRSVYDLTANFSPNLASTIWVNPSSDSNHLWGFADTMPVRLPLDEFWTLADPLVLGETGTGGDAIDLDWARHPSGEIPAPYELTNLRLIRLTTAIELILPLVGELSTEIDAIGVPE